MNDKAGILIRVSTTRQGERGASVKTQRQDCLAYAERQGWQVVMIEEDHISGVSFDRPGFRKLAAAAKEDVIDKLVVYSLDRFGRGDMLTALSELQGFDDAGCEIHSIRDGGLVEDSLIRDIRLAINKDFSRQLSDKVSRNMTYRAEQGKWMSGAPFGYRIVTAPDGIGRTLEPDPDTAWAVPELFRMADEGQTETALVGFARKHSLRSSRTPPGRTLSRSSIRRMLENPVYVGKVLWNRRGHGRFRPKGKRSGNDIVAAEGLHTALVNEETFNRVQARLGQRRTYKTYTKRNVFLVDGLVFCGKCGAKMRGSGHTIKGRKYRYYYCANAHDRYACDQARISADRVDEQVRAVIDERFNVANVTTDAALKVLVERRDSLRKGFGDVRVRLERRREELGRKQERTLNELMNEGLTDIRRGALERLLQAYEQELDAIGHELRSLRPQGEQLRDIEQAIEWFQDLALVETTLSDDDNTDGLAAARHVTKTSAECWGVNEISAWQQLARQFIHRAEIEGRLAEGRIRIEWSATAQSILHEEEKVLQLTRTVLPTAGTRWAARWPSPVPSIPKVAARPS